jgi:hypothetical protein
VADDVDRLALAGVLAVDVDRQVAGDVLDRPLVGGRAVSDHDVAAVLALVGVAIAVHQQELRVGGERGRRQHRQHQRRAGRHRGQHPSSRSDHSLIPAHSKPP